MLRTIIVALVFAGITVCSYYYLNSSQFPWEIANPGNNMAQTSQNPAENNPDERTYAQDSPFASPPAAEDEFSLPGMDELPPAEMANPSEGNPMVAASTAQLPTSPISDTDLPSLNDQQNSLQFESTPAPIQAQHQGQIGSNAIVDETQALPAPEDDMNLDLPPAPSLDTNPGDLPTPSPIQEPPVSYPTPNQGTVTNPLRQSVPAPAPAPVQTPYICPTPAPAPSGPAMNEIPSPATEPSNEIDAEAEAAAETAAIREYLKIAKEKIKNGEALEVLRQLSKFYGNPRFTAEESSELVDILVLAATQVIYSQKSFIDPPYTVKPDDTVEKIAAEYNIPKEFIILVNGLQPGVPLEPGRQLKVVRGPFHVLVYLDRHEMILTLNGLFAGRFWIGIGSQLIQKDSDFSFAGQSTTQTEIVQMPCCDFVLTSGEQGCAEMIKIQACNDPSTYNTPSSAILMSQTDVQNLCAVLGPKSQLLMRCYSLKPADPQTASGSNPAPVPPPVSVPAPAPAPVPAPAPAYGSSAELPNSLPNTLPDTLSAPAPAPAPASPAEELPFELPATL
ncbi:MAG: LysM peptidoglycan-binding domain-containing protein [Thermoguttaceae bacterium]|nr:LysM peptidoglycan-binding domain-containing protein [Thermoguttaceae bacterium]